MWKLLQDPCFGNDNTVTNCTSSLLIPASLTLSAAVKSYMRQPKCTSDLIWYQETINPSGLSSATTTLTDTKAPQTVQWNWGATSTYPPGLKTIVQAAPALRSECCGKCQIYGPNVDVFYWPEPGSDKSCLSVIGDRVNPLGEGASTDGQGNVWWGTVTNPYDIYVGTHTTARIVTINGITLKQNLVNPWSDGTGTDMPSVTTTRPIDKTQTQDTSIITPAPRTARARARLIKRSLPDINGTSPGNGSLPDSIAISNGFTFTSPSIYVAFTDLKASDQCGFRGIGTIHSTMLAFTPGELSTIEGALLGAHYSSPGPSATKVFNFADLPCPPRSVMEANWYKPAPGEPYRPLIALPSKVLSLDPSWADCTDAFYFTGLDPPRTLQAGRRMGPGSGAGSQSADPGQSVPAQAPNTGPAFNPALPTDAPGCQPNCASPSFIFVHAPAVLVPASILAPIQSPATPVANGAAPGPIIAPTIQDPPPVATNLPPGFHFGAGQHQADPNSIDPAAASQLHQALSPAVNSAYSDSQPQSQPHPVDTNTLEKPPQSNQSPDQVPGQMSDASQPAPQPPNIVLGGSTYQVPAISSQPAPTVHGNPITNLPDGRKQVAGQDLAPGGPPAIVGASTVQVDQQGNLVVNGNAYGPRPTAATATTLGHTIVNNGPSGVQVDGVNLPTGSAAPALIGGTSVQINQNGSPIIDGQYYPQLPKSGSTQVAGHTFVNSGNGYSVDGQQVDKGAAPVTIGGTPAHIVDTRPANSNSLPDIKLPASVPSALTTLPGGQTVESNNGGYQIQGHVLSQGGQPVVISGSTYSLGPSNSVHVNDQAYSLPEITSVASTTIAGQAVVPFSNGISIDGKTLHLGDAPITISNSIPVSLGSSALVIGSSTVSVNQQASPILSTVNAAGHILTEIPNNAGYAINGATLSPGRPAVTISGTAYSLAPSGSALVVGTSTIPLATTPSNSANGAQNGTLTAAGETFIPLGASAISISGTTLSVGGPAITDSNGSAISLATGGIVVGSSTFAFAAPATPTASTPVQPVATTTPASPPSGPAAAGPTPTTLTTDGQVLTVQSGGKVVVAGTTLSAGGPAATISGTPVSVGPGDVVIGGSTVSLQGPGATATGVPGSSAATRVLCGWCWSDAGAAGMVMVSLLLAVVREMG